MALRALLLPLLWLGLYLPGRATAASVPRIAASGVRLVVPPYLQDVRTDGIVVAWATDVPSTGVVRLDPLVRAAFLSTPGLYHRVRLSGLSPGTRYRYVVAARPLGMDNAPETQSQPAEFATAPLHGPFMFLVYGDNRDREADHAAVIQAMLQERPDFILQTGDMVGKAGEEGPWRRYFSVAAPLLRATPIYPALGNHELRGDPEANHFFRYFVLPGNPLARRRPVYYAFRYSNALFVALDGNSPYDAEQAAWLDRTLAASQADPSVRHVFVFVHQPPYAVGAYCGSERIQRRLVPLFLRYQVRAVFAGHEHAYQHLERGGLRYFVSGGGGAPLYFRSQSCNPEDDMALRLFRPQHHYLRVQIDGDAVTLLAIAKNGEIMERVLLHQPVPPDKGSGPVSPPLALTVPSQAVAEPKRKGREPLLLLWISALAVFGGLLMLTKPGLRRKRRLDLLPGARRQGRAR